MQPFLKPNARKLRAFGRFTIQKERFELKMFDKFNPFNIESKGNIMIEIKGEMDAQGAKEVSQTVAEGKRFFIKCAGVALILCVVGYFVLRFIQAA